MVERKEEKTFEEELFSLREDFGFHISEDHRGKPSSTCHTCINYRYKIQFAEEKVRFPRLDIATENPSVS